MANCDATSSEVLDLSTLTESVAGDDATEQSEALGSCQAQSIYLITYSQANKEIVPNRESFVQLVQLLFSVTVHHKGRRELLTV